MGTGTKESLLLRSLVHGAGRLLGTLLRPGGWNRRLAIAQRRSFAATTLKPQTPKLGDSLEFYPLPVLFENGRLDLLCRSLTVDPAEILPYAHGFRRCHHSHVLSFLTIWQLPQT